MKHRILSLIAAVVLCLSVCPVQALAAETEGEGVPPVVDTGEPPVMDSGMGFRRAAAQAGKFYISGSYVFASGNPIVIKQNEQNASITSVYSEDGRLLSGDTDVKTYNICGGWNAGNSTYYGNTSITMESGTVKSIYGGNYTGSKYNGTLKGDTNVVIQGGTITGSLYGGNCRGTLDGNTNIEINGGKVTSYIFGGGYSSKITGVTNVVLNGGNCNSVCGGGYGCSVKNTRVQLNGGECYNTYGGGYGGTVEQATVEMGTDWGGWVLAGGYNDTTESMEVIVHNYATTGSQPSIMIEDTTAQEVTVIVRRDDGGPLNQANPDAITLKPTSPWNIVVEYGTVVFWPQLNKDITLGSLDIKPSAQVQFFGNHDKIIDINKLICNGGQFLLPVILKTGTMEVVDNVPIKLGEIDLNVPLIVLNAYGWPDEILENNYFFFGDAVDALDSTDCLFAKNSDVVLKEIPDGGGAKGIYFKNKPEGTSSIYIPKAEFNETPVPYNGTVSLTVGVTEAPDVTDLLPDASIQIRGRNHRDVLFASVQVSADGKSATVTGINGVTSSARVEGGYITFALPVTAELLDTCEEGLYALATAPDNKYSDKVPLVGPGGETEIEITPAPITLTKTVPEPAFEDPLESDLEEGPFYTASVRWHPAAGVSSAFQMDRDYQADIILTPKAGHWLSAESIGSTVNYNGQDIPCVFNTDGTVTLPNQKTARFQSRTVTVAASPAVGGTVTGGGRYLPGTRVTVTATPAPDFRFDHWEENGTAVSADPAYSFTVAANRTLAARFEKIQYTVTLTASPAEGGTVTGAGSYEIGSPVTVIATPAPGWKFTGWCEGETVISADAEYAFSIAANRALTARFASEKMKPDCNALTSPPGDLANHPDLNTVEKIMAKLRQVVEAHISGVGNNLAVYDVILVYEDTGLPVEPENFPTSGINAVLPYPDGTNGTDYTFTIQHMIAYGPSAGTVENMSYTAGTDGLTCHFTSLSPVAIGWQKKDAPKPTPTGGSSGSEKSDDEYDFWQEVRRKIEKAAPGDTVRVNARGYDKMSWTVMDALKNHSVTLVIRWSGGEDIVIPAGKALDEPSRIYYPLSYLAGYRFGTVAVNPETGGVWLVEAPASAEPALTSDGTPRITDAGRGLAETPELARQGIEKAVTGADEPAGPAAEQGTAPKDSAAAPALLLLAVSACGGLWAWKTRKDRPGN